MLEDIALLAIRFSLTNIAHRITVLDNVRIDGRIRCLVVIRRHEDKHNVVQLDRVRAPLTVARLEATKFEWFEAKLKTPIECRLLRVRHVERQMRQRNTSHHYAASASSG